MNFQEIESYLSALPISQNLSTGQEIGLRLNEFEVYGLCDLVGIDRCPAEFLPVSSLESLKGEEANKWCNNASQLANEDGRLILKIVGRNILHKTEAGGVKVLKLIEDRPAEELLGFAKTLVKTMVENGLMDEVDGILAAAFVPHESNRPGQEVLLSLRQDPAFGPCVVIGIGGTLTEWYGATGNSTLIFPASGIDEDFLLKSIESHPLLNLLCVPSRLYLEPPLNSQKLAHAVSCLGQLGTHFGPGGESQFTLEEIEINPAVASMGKLVALDGVGLVSNRKWSKGNRPLEKINPLLEPKSAVVMGVSAKGANPGKIILKNLLSSPGIDPKRLYVVHHRETEIAGVPCFASPEALPEKCDLAVVSVPAQGAFDAISGLVEQDKAQSIILIPGGFAEAGESELAAQIEKVLVDGHNLPGGGPVMVGGNCLGIVSRDNYNTFFLPQYKLPFNPGLGENLAVVSQSGAYLVTFASNYDGIIYPRASISFGNQMDLTAADFLAHFNNIPEVNVIACYVEGFRPGDGDKFLEQARIAQELGKRVIIFKAGKTALGAKAAASHTASLAGDYAVARACLESAGVTVAESLDEFEDLLKTFTLLAGKKVSGNRTGIISNAGFECSTVMDQLDGLDLGVFDDKTQKALDEILPGFAHRSNPIDCTPMTGTEAFCESCRAILDCPAIDVGILASVPVTPTLDNLMPSETQSHREDLNGKESQPNRMIKIIQGSAKPAVVVVDSGVMYDPMCVMMEKAGIPVFRKIDRAARALSAFCNG